MRTLSNKDSSALNIDKPRLRTFRQGITEKQANFCKFYVDCGQESFQNATISAKLAGFNPLRANEAGCKLLKLQHIQDRIQELEQALASNINWDRPKFEGEVVKCYESLPVTNANKFKYLELIGKVKHFFDEAPVNTFIFSNSSKDIIIQRVKDITSRLSNTLLFKDSLNMNNNQIKN